MFPSSYNGMVSSTTPVLHNPVLHNPVLHNPVLHNPVFRILPPYPTGIS
jgi:hypothetical protein